MTCLLNRGNRGDGIIHSGARLLFKQKKIDTTYINHPTEASGKTLFVFGCGAFCKLYNHMIGFTLHYLDQFEGVYILPTSFEVSYKPVRDFLKRLPQKVRIFVRERYSYEQAHKVLRYPRKLFMHQDLAFYFDPSSFMQLGKEILVSFRTDEAFPDFVSQKLINQNKDVSRGGHAGNWKFFMQEISEYREVHTNRAHVAIGATLLGKKVFVYPGAYHKLKGIYEYSLHKFDNVEWIQK